MADTIYLNRNGKRYMKFVGDMIAKSSSKTNQGPGQNRWTDLELYKTKTGYAASISHETIWQNEHTIDDALFDTTAKGLVDKLEQALEGFPEVLKELVANAIAVDSAFEDLDCEEF